MSTLEIILTILSVVSTLCAIGFGFAAFRRNQKRDDTDEGSSRGTILSELGFIKGGVEDIKAEQREQRKTNTEVVERLAGVEASNKSAHKRIDMIERKVNGG